MSIKQITLTDGIKVGEIIHKDVEFRDLTAGDILEANEEAERVVQLNDGTVSVATSAARLGMELLRRRITRFGEIKIPLSLTELLKISEADLEALQDAVSELDTLRKVSEQGRS